MKKIYYLIALCFVFGMMHSSLKATVLYSEGSFVIGNVQLLRDMDNAKAYYYVPTVPHLARKPDGTFEFLCLKYVGENGDASGGLFHALVEFTLPDTALAIIEKELKKRVPGAFIAGAVPMMTGPTKEGEEAPSSFDIVSAVLSNTEGKEALTRTTVKSGYAPFTPGSKAAIAALLNQQGATLLWNSLTGPTSDVSVSVHGYYIAAVKAYNAVVTAEMTTIYKHFSEIQSKQKDFTKKQIRNVVDDLKRTGGLKVDVFDQSSGLGIKASELEAILSLVTNKLTELMFDTKAGWAKDPEKIDAMAGVTETGRQEDNLGEEVGQAIANAASFGLANAFNPRDKNPKYITDDQYVLKDVKEVKSNKFYLNLSKTTTIKVPVHSSGNIGGIFQAYGQDQRYFRIINMNDPAFQKREVHFQVDGEYLDAFNDLVNFVAVNFRKKYPNGHEDVTEKLMFNAADLKAGLSLKSISFPRLGIETADWINYEYQILWSLKGDTRVIRIPNDETKWIKSGDPAVSLVLPFKKEYIEVDADRALFKEKNTASANISFGSKIGGKSLITKSLTLRANDPESNSKVSVYHDPNTPIVYRTTWYATTGEKEQPLAELKTNYLFLVPAN
ncbi:MAG TPA: hypothetical protein VFF27_04375 [Bacteroidia bacterium]|jgi:hypothetical protein|nr:hypothetical protein [Bacteroidia bacterium]